MQVAVRCLCFALSLIYAPMLRAEPVTVTMVDGQTMEGNITEWTTEKVVVTAEGKTRSVTPQELLVIHVNTTSSTESESDSPLWIELSDGSRLPFMEFSIQNRMAAILTPLSESPVRLLTEKIRSVQFAPAGRTAIDRTSSDLAGDYLVLIKKDSDETETLIGVVGDVTTEQVEFTWEGDTVPVKLSKIAAIGFHQPETSEPPEPLCVLSLSSGATVQVSTISVLGDSLDVLTVGGVRLKLALAEVTKVDYSAGKLTFLSDMEPLKSRWTPLIALPPAATTIKDYGTPRRNISFTGSPLTLSRQGESGTDRTLETYDKGLALRSRTELEYRLPKSMRRFVATAGLDPDTQEQGNVLLRLEVDGQTAFEQVIDGKQQPLEIDVDVTDKQRLKILVDYGENLDTGDRLHLVEARLIK